MKTINLDHAAAAHLEEEVVQAMISFFGEHYGNPSSGHDLGRRPKEALEEARAAVARLVGAEPREVIFTASASEANNLAIKGLLAGRKKEGGKIISSAVEHFSILNPLRSLEKSGYRVQLLPVDGDGLVSVDALREAMDENTALVTIQAANPEIGTVQRLAALAAAAGDEGVPFHTDAAAAAGWLPLEMQNWGINLLTIASDQLGGPRGAAALVISRGTRVMPQVEGGVQERGLRAGSENVPALAGFGTAARLSFQRMGEDGPRLAALRDDLKDRLFARLPHLYLNGHPEHRLPRNLNLSVRFVEGEALLMRLNMAGIYVSSGSTCSSAALKSSHVLAAIGRPPELAQGSLQFTLGRDFSADDIDYVAEKLGEAAETLRQMSPLYHKYLKEEKSNA